MQPQGTDLLNKDGTSKLSLLQQAHMPASRSKGASGFSMGSLCTRQVCYSPPRVSAFLASHHPGDECLPAPPHAQEKALPCSFPTLGPHFLPDLVRGAGDTAALLPALPTAKPGPGQQASSTHCSTHLRAGGWWVHRIALPGHLLRGQGHPGLELFARISGANPPAQHQEPPSSTARAWKKLLQNKVVFIHPKGPHEQSSA